MPGRRARRACRRPAICRSRRSSARAGVKDMVRISDARMSGTAFGTIVLHITPESAVGGPLALVQERRHDPARCRQAQHRASGRRGRAEEAPCGAEAGRDGRMGAARLWLALQRDHFAGRRGLRLRFHARARARGSRSIRHCERRASAVSSHEAAMHSRASSLRARGSPRYAPRNDGVGNSAISQLRYVSRSIDNQTTAMG